MVDVKYQKLLRILLIHTSTFYPRGLTMSFIIKHPSYTIVPQKFDHMVIVLNTHIRSKLVIFKKFSSMLLEELRLRTHDINNDAMFSTTNAKGKCKASSGNAKKPKE